MIGKIFQRIRAHREEKRATENAKRARERVLKEQAQYRDDFYIIEPYLRAALPDILLRTTGEAYDPSATLDELIARHSIYDEGPKKERMELDDFGFFPEGQVISGILLGSPRMGMYYATREATDGMFHVRYCHYFKEPDKDGAIGRVGFLQYRIADREAHFIGQPLEFVWNEIRDGSWYMHGENAQLYAIQKGSFGDLKT